MAIYTPKANVDVEDRNTRRFILIRLDVENLFCAVSSQHMPNNNSRAFESLGPALRFLRKEKGWTLAHVGDASEDHGSRLSAANISRYERDLVTPDLPTLERLLAALDVTLEELALVLRRVRGESHAARRVAELLVAAATTSDLVLTDERRAELSAK